MPFSFGIVFSAMWTVAALINLTSGAPAAIKSTANKDSITEQSKCLVFEYIVMPPYDGVSADQKSYDLTIPLEVCYGADDEAAAPLCQEAHKLLNNISSCSPEVEMLQAVREYVAEKSKSIAIEPQADVCSGFMHNRNLFGSSSFALKLSDPVVCPFICRKAMEKACTFLLWGYQVQANIHDIYWNEIVSKQPLEEKVEKRTEHEQNVSVSGENPSKGSGSANEEKTEGASDTVKDKNAATTISGDMSSTEKGKSSGNITGGSKPAETGLRRSASDVNLLNSNAKPTLGTKEPQSTDEVSKSMGEGSESELKNSKPKEIADAGSSSLPSAQQVSADGDEGNSTSPAGVTTSVIATKKTKSSLTAAQNDLHPTKGNQEENVNQNKTNTEESEEHKSSAKSANGILKQTGATVPDGNSGGKNGDVKFPEGGEENGISRSSPAPQDNTGKVSSTVDTKSPETPMSDDVSNANQEAKDGGKNSKGSKISAEDSNTSIDSLQNEENPDLGISETNHDDNDDNKPQDHDNASDGVSVSDKGTEGDTGGEGSSVETFSVSNMPSFGDLVEGGSNYVDDIGDDSGIGDEEKSKDDGVAEHDKSTTGDTGSDNRSNVQSPGQQTNVNRPGSGMEEPQIIHFPEQEDTHFFFYFVTIIVFAIGGYVLFHNKQKIFALIIEGRHERRRRSGASYRKLETK